MKPNEVMLQKVEDLGTFRVPPSDKVLSKEGQALSVAVDSIVSVATHTFTFRENSGYPGRLLTQSVPIYIPPGAYPFTCISYFTGAYTTSDFRYLTERPLGQLYASIHVDESDSTLKCTVRLTDVNADDPILIQVTGTAVFYS